MIYLTTFMEKAVEPSQVVQPRHTPRGGGDFFFWLANIFNFPL
jgi:hypothetical protein